MQHKHSPGQPPEKKLRITGDYTDGDHQIMIYQVNKSFFIKINLIIFREIQINNNNKCINNNNNNNNVFSLFIYIYIYIYYLFRSCICLFHNSFILIVFFFVSTIINFEKYIFEKNILIVFVFL